MKKQISYKDKYIFILNGPDLEMDEILKVLKKEKINWIMPYQEKSQKIIKANDLTKYKKDDRLRVYVECWPEKRIARTTDVLIDHHNEFIKRRGALIQVKKLLNLKITEHDLWVEAYDRAGVYGALKFGVPKKIVSSWIDDNLKRAKGRKNKIQIINTIKKAKSINGTKIIKIKLSPKENRSRVTYLAQIYDFTTYPKKQNMLVIVYQGRSIAKYSFFSDQAISKKLHKKFGGYLFGNPALKNVCWGIKQNTLNMPAENKVIEIINQHNATHKK